MTLKAQVARGIKWKFITFVGRQVLSFFVFTSLARLLDPSAFGLVGLVGVYLAFVNMFVDQGIGMAIVQRQNLETDHLHAAFWFNMGCGLLLSLGTVLLANPIASIFGEPQLAPLLRWSSLGLLIGAATEIQATLLIKEMDFRRSAIRILLGVFIGGLTGVAMALNGFGVWSLVGQQLVTPLAGSVFLWTVGNYRPAFRFSLRHLRDLLHVSTSVFASGFLWFFTARFDQVIIGRFAGVPVLGLYVVAVKIPDLARTAVHDGISDVSVPALAKLQKDHPRMCQTICSGMELNAVVSFAVFVGIAAIAQDLIPLLFGAQWTNAGRLCSLFALYTLINTLQVFFHPALLASGGMGRWVLLNVCHAAGVVAACLVGIQFGVQYLIVGLIIKSLFIFIPALLFLRQLIGLNPLDYCKPCILPGLASVVMFVLVRTAGQLLPLEAPAPARIACCVILGAASYATVIYVFNRRVFRQLIENIRHMRGSGAGALPSGPSSA